jgi:hypothetical protein
MVVGGCLDSGQHTATAGLADNTGPTDTSSASIESPPFPQTLLVPPASDWKYFKGVSEASSPDSSAWRQLGFDDNDWLTGPSPFYYELGTGYTGNSVLPDMATDFTCLFLRRSFQVPNPGVLLRL